MRVYRRQKANRNGVSLHAVFRRSTPMSDVAVFLESSTYCKKSISCALLEVNPINLVWFTKFDSVSHLG